MVNIIIAILLIAILVGIFYLIFKLSVKLFNLIKKLLDNSFGRALKNIVNVVILLVSLSLGFILNFAIEQINMEALDIIAWAYGIVLCVYPILFFLNIITYEHNFELSPIFGIASLIIGTYYYVSEGLVYWIKGIFLMIALIFYVGFKLLPLLLVAFVLHFIYEMVSPVSGSYSPSTNSYSNNSYKNKKSDPIVGDISRTFFNDGSTGTSVKTGGKLRDYTGITQVGEIKNKYGETVGTSTTYDYGYGIVKTVYKDKNGNEVTSRSVKL